MTKTENDTKVGSNNTKEGRKERTKGLKTKESKGKQIINWSS
jgi:hypothetical protein